MNVSVRLSMWAGGRVNVSHQMCECVNVWMCMFVRLMMVAFNTTKSSLVRFMEGLCGSNQPHKPSSSQFYVRIFGFTFVDSEANVIERNENRKKWK